MSEEFIVGKNPVIEALRSGHTINKIWIAEGAQKGQMAKVIDLAKQQKVLVQQAPKRKLEQLVKTTNHQGVVASIGDSYGT